MKKLIAIILLLAAAIIARGGEFVYTNPVPVYVESRTFEKMVSAQSISVDQVSLLRVKSGKLSARAVCTVTATDGSKSRRVIQVDQDRVAAVIGAEQTAALAAQLDFIFAAVLAAESNGQ